MEYQMTILPYPNDDETLDRIVIVDIDGTVALKHPDRDIHDYHMVHLDLPNLPVIKTVQALMNERHKVIFVTGRKDDCREETRMWLSKYFGTRYKLFMRKSGDNRPDWVVKYEIFQEHIQDQYRVLCVFDDRDQVVHLWRRLLKIPTFQVADGDF